MNKILKEWLTRKHDEIYTEILEDEPTLNVLDFKERIEIVNAIRLELRDKKITYEAYLIDREGIYPDTIITGKEK